MNKKLYNGKTQKEWLEQLSESISILNLSYNDGNIQDKNRRKEIFIYFDNNGNILSDSIINALKHFYKVDGYIAKELKTQLNIDDNWEENCIIIDSESICQLLFFMDKEDILSTIKDMMNCLCK